MSKQLTFSATLSTIAMTAMAFAMCLGGPGEADGARAAIAHGSIVSVLLRA